MKEQDRNVRSNVIRRVENAMRALEKFMTPCCTRGEQKAAS